MSQITEAVAAAIGAVWDDRCGGNRNGLYCETCMTLTDLCDVLGIEPPPPKDTL